MPLTDSDRVANLCRNPNLTYRFGGLNVGDLRAMLKSRKLSTKGSREELAARLTGTTCSSSQMDEERLQRFCNNPGLTYSLGGLNSTHIKQELQRLGLPVTGKRRELADRLSVMLSLSDRCVPNRYTPVKKRETVFRSEDYTGTFVIGDIHGDLGVYLRFLLATGSCDFDTGATRLLKDLTSRPFDETAGVDHFEASIPDRLAGVKWKTGCRNLLIFNGDVLDNRRPKRISPALDDTYPMKHLVSLHRQAAQQGGCVVHMIGNHELGNIRDRLHCERYAPQVHCQDDNPVIFNIERKEMVYNFVDQIDSLAAVVVDEYLICHGGLSHKFLDDIGHTDLDEINKLYTKAVQGGKLPDGFEKYDLTWYRPLRAQRHGNDIIEKDKLALESLTSNGSKIGLKYCIIAHTIVKDNDSGKSLVNGYLYPCDFGMSSVFRGRHAESISYLSISRNGVRYLSGK